MLKENRDALAEFYKVPKDPIDIFMQVFGKDIKKQLEKLNDFLSDADRILAPVVEARAKFNALLPDANVNFGELERLGILPGDPAVHKDDQEVPRGRWAYHAGFGGFIRYNFHSYKGAEVQVYMPQRYYTRHDAQGRITAIVAPNGQTLTIHYKELAGDLPKNITVLAFESIEISENGKSIHTLPSGETLIGDVPKDWSKNSPPEIAQNLTRYEETFLQLQEFFNRNCRVKDKKKRTENWSDLVNLTHLIYAVGTTDKPYSAANQSPFTAFLREAWLAQISSSVRHERIYMQEQGGLQANSEPRLQLVAAKPTVRQDKQGTSVTQIGGDKESAGEYAGGEVAIPGQLGRQRLGISPQPEEEPEPDPAIKIVSYEPKHNDTKEDYPNAMIFPLQAAILPAEKASTVHWSFTLKKPQKAAESSFNLSFDVAVADCVDKPFELKLDLRDSGIEGELTITAETTINGKTAKDSVTLPVEIITQVEDLPGIMRNLGWNKGAELMDSWQTAQEYTVSMGEDPPLGEKLADKKFEVKVKDITIEWLISDAANTDVNGTINNIYKPAFEKALTKDPLITINHYNKLMEKYQNEIARLKVGERFRFNDYREIEYVRDPKEFHRKHQTQHVPTMASKWVWISRYWNYPVTEGTATVGDTSFYIAPKGFAYKDMNGRIIWIIESVAVYFIDSYDFNGDSPLGFWKKPDKVAGSGSRVNGSTLMRQHKKTPFLKRYTSLNDNYYVDYFSSYRMRANKGGDFLIVAPNLTIKKFDKPFAFTSVPRQRGVPTAVEVPVPDSKPKSP